MSPVRPVVLPQAPKPDNPNALSIAPTVAVTRRGVVRRALVSGADAALVAGWLPDAAAAQDAIPVSSDDASTIDPVSGQALYSLSRDHRWHRDPFYMTSEYWEWHYWTGLVTDVTKGEEWGLFYTWSYTQCAPGDIALDE